MRKARYPRPAVTVDCVVFGASLDEGELKVLLVERGHEPFAGRWALPGGFVEIDEPLEDAARRELAEETQLSGVRLEQLHTFGDPGRDPRGWTISVAHLGLVKLSGQEVRGGTDARRAAWVPVRKAKRLAFDHDRILAAARERLREKVLSEPIAFELLPRNFTLPQVRCCFQVLLERPLDERDFRKWILGAGALVEIEEVARSAGGRAARLYRFHREKHHGEQKRRPHDHRPR